MITSKSIIRTTDTVLRKAMYLVFDGMCFYTGRQLTIDDIHIDHVLPKALGGEDCIENFVLCCGYINCKKHSKSNADFVERILQINKLLFVDKVVSEYNNLKINDILKQGMVNVNDFLKAKKLNTHPQRTSFVQKAKRNLPYIEYYPLASVQFGKVGLSTKKRFYFDKDALEILFVSFKFR